MFYLTEIQDYVRVDPTLFGLPTQESVSKQLDSTYEDFYDPDFGKVVSVIGILDIGEGIIIPGDGATYYKCLFKLLVWKPELQELVYGKVAEITNFGAFMDMGSMQGMIHISQTMDDFVSFNDAGSLSGKASGRVLKVGDLCVARIVAISHKSFEVKTGLTMRQDGLGKLEWLKEDKAKKENEVKKVVKKETKGVKKK